MQGWTLFLEGRGNADDAERFISKAIDELRKNGHDVSIARMSRSDEATKDVSRKYTGAGAG